MSPPPLSLADQLLVNLAGSVAVDPMPQADVLSDGIEEIARVLGRVSRDSVRIRDLADACQALVEAYPTRRLRAAEGELHLWSRAMFDVRMALFELFRWRAGEAHRRVYAEAAP